MAGLLDALASGQWGGNDDQNSAMNRAIFSLGAGLLSRTHGVPFTKALGDSLLGAQQQYDAYGKAQLDEKLKKAQIGNFASEAEWRKAQAEKMQQEMDLARRKLAMSQGIIGSLNAQLSPQQATMSGPAEMGGEGLPTDYPVTVAPSALDRNKAYGAAARAAMAMGDNPFANALTGLYKQDVEAGKPTQMGANWVQTPDGRWVHMPTAPAGATFNADGSLGAIAGAVPTISALELAQAEGKARGTTYGTPQKYLDAQGNERMALGADLFQQGGAPKVGRSAEELAGIKRVNANEENAYTSWQKGVHDVAVAQGASARNTAMALSKMANLIPEAYDAKLGNFKLSLAEWANTIGLASPEQLDRISKSRTFDGLAKELQLMKSDFMKGAVSDFEQKLAAATVPDRLGPKEAALYQIKILQDYADYRIEKARFYQSNSKYAAEDHRSVDAAWRLREKQLAESARYRSYFQ